MPFVINDAYLPATLTAQPMTDEEFAEFCGDYSDLNFEMTSQGEITVEAPSDSLTGASRFEVAGELRNWARKDGRGIGCDSSAGFVLPDGARRSPDATLKSRVKAIEAHRRKGFWHLCPDFVIEIKSDSDRLRTLRKKMGEYLANGAQLGWLIDDRLAGEGLVDGFVLDLTYVWDPLAE
jgi:Uma2 family endonuclease